MRVSWERLLVATAVVVNLLNATLLLINLARTLSDVRFNGLAAELAARGQSFTAYVVAPQPVEGALKVWRGAGGLYVSKVVWTPSLRLPPGSSVYAYEGGTGKVSLFSVFPSPLPVGTVNPVFEVHGVYGTRYTGRGVRVAVVDTGVDYEHPDLRDAIYAMVSFIVRTSGGRPLVWIVGFNGTLEEARVIDEAAYSQLGTYAWRDENGHGTHVCGIIAGSGAASAGRFRGVAPGAKLVVVKVFDRNGQASLDDVLDALEWLADRQTIDVVNLSFGGEDTDPNSPLAVVAARLADSGKLVFAAAGNEGQLPGTILAPASSPKVFAVAAYDPFRGVVAPFSSMGPSPSADKPDFAAVGVAVCAPFPTYTVTLERAGVTRVMGYYACLSGTSMATAVASGLGALHVQAAAPLRVTAERLAKYSLPVQPVKGWLAGHGLLTAP